MKTLKRSSQFVSVIYAQALTRFDPFEKIAQSGLVRRVAGEDRAGQWQAIRRDDQSDHDLPAIGPAKTAGEKNGHSEADGGRICGTRGICSPPGGARSR